MALASSVILFTSFRFCIICSCWLCFTLIQYIILSVLINPYNPPSSCRYNLVQSLAGPELLHHHGLLTNVLDLLDHIQFLLHVALVSLEDHHVLVDSGISCLMRAPGQSSHLTELGPALAFIHLRPAGEDALDHLHLLRFDDVVLVVALHHFLEGLADRAAYHRH